MKKNIFIIVIISISISVTLVSTWLSYRNAVRSSEDFLKAQALVIATSLENTIIKYGTNENIFSDIITGGRWQGIAFLALYDTGGLTILHSNRNLINKRINRTLIQKTADTGDIQYSRTALGTGETVFLLDFPVQAKGSMMVLRVALHTYPSLGTVRQERLHLLSILVIILILSIITTFFLILSKKRQELERTLVEKEKLSVIGEMASVLAHEIRNPLGSIKGFAQYLKEQFTGRRQPDKGLSEKYIDVIVTESRRIETLTEDLLTYARQDELRLEEFDLPVLINEVMSSINLPEDIRVTVNLPKTRFMTSDRDKVRQIILNLIQNSLDAMDKGGSLTVTSEDKKNSTGLSVSDTGTGIDPDSTGKVFKPFYTTKAKGTGLGLAIVWRYISALGGKISVESEKDKGTTFRILIPKKIKR